MQTSRKPKLIFRPVLHCTCIMYVLCFMFKSWYLLLRKTGFVGQELGVGCSVFSSPSVWQKGRRGRQVNLETSTSDGLLTILPLVWGGGIQRRSSWLTFYSNEEAAELWKKNGCRRMKQKLFCGVLSFNFVSTMALRTQPVIFFRYGFVYSWIAQA